MNRYKAFGLTIESEMRFSELLVADGSERPDIMIAKGKVPDDFKGIIRHNKKIGTDQFLLDNPGIAKFYVEKGETIIIEPYENSSWEEVKLFLLGSCMGAALYQRRILPIHGSCIDIGGNGIILTGKSGSGKSTVASAMISKGCRIVTDDVAAIQKDEMKQPYVAPSYPSQKLWRDAIDRSACGDQIHSLNRVANGMEKFSVSRKECFCDTSIPLRGICEIIPAQVSDIAMEEVTGMEKLRLIMRNSYRRFMPKAMDIQDWYFRQCVLTADKIDAYRIVRPENQHLENLIADILLKKTCEKYT